MIFRKEIDALYLSRIPGKMPGLGLPEEEPEILTA
jgi:hypothetical protein